MDEQTTAPIEGEQQATTQDWKGELDSYYAEKLEKFKSPAELGKSYVELEKSMGSRVKIPDENDTEGWEHFYQKIGRPEGPEAYKTNIPEGAQVNEDFVKTIQEASYNAGLNQGQWSKLEHSYNQFVAQTADKQIKEIERINTERWAKYRGEWGEDTTTENIELAKRTFDELAPEELKEMITVEQIEQDPLLVNLYSTVGRKLMDDTLIKGTPKTEGEWTPPFKNSPEMYASGEDEISVKAREYYTKRGHKY